MSPSAIVQDFEQALLAVDRGKARMIMSQIAGGPTWDVALVEELIVPALDHIGQGWCDGTVSLAQVYVSGRICEELFEVAIPAGNAQQEGAPRIALAVLEDYHMLGKRLVFTALRASGYAVLDYGRVTVDELLAKIRQDGIEWVLVSTLMLPSALRVKVLCSQIREQGLKVKVVVGGAPFRLDSNLWREVGADAMGSAASESVSIIRRLAVGGA